jgi:hypothetical protein
MSIKERAMARRNQVKTEAVPMPEWGEGTVVHVRELTALERDAYEAQQSEAHKAGQGLKNFRARLVIATARDEAGKPIFGDEDLGDVGDLPAGEVRRLFDAAAKLNALTAAEEKAIEKNS